MVHFNASMLVTYAVKGNDIVTKNNVYLNNLRYVKDDKGIKQNKSTIDINATIKILKKNNDKKIL